MTEIELIQFIACLNTLFCFSVLSQFVEKSQTFNLILTFFFSNFILGGERPMRLTSGEVVGIAVGSALGLILVFIGCIILRNNGKSSPLPFHGHIPGQRV